MRAFFYGLADALAGLLEPGEVFLAYLAAEDSDFVRFNRNKVRQAGRVRQIELTLELIEGRRHTGASCTLSGGMERDLPLIQALLARLRAQCRLIPEDPYLLYATKLRNTEEIQLGTLPEAATAVREIITAAKGLDLVGFWASGALYRGFANSLGQRNWYSSAPFNLDWSCYRQGDKAVKSGYAGFEWNQEKLSQRMDAVRNQLELLGKLPKTIEPGCYRVYLAPSALKEIFWLLAWDSFGLKSHKTRQTAFIKMIQEGRTLHPWVSLTENNRAGLGPGFTEAGFIKPERVELIERGGYSGCLVNPRSSQEYGVAVNSSEESPASLDLAPGTLPLNEVLKRLDTGVYINNLWYCNFSDRNDARITGMTRYACFWVEQGQLMAPTEVMRFDESLYNLLGERLLGLTVEREFIFDPDTYFRRSVSSLHLPGALVEDFRFTL
jgi:predicted Zn-dependent protease